MGASESTAKGGQAPQKQVARRGSAESVKYIPPSVQADKYLDEFTVYNKDREYTIAELKHGADVLEKRAAALQNDINKLTANGAKELLALYESITDGSGSSADASRDQKHRHLNRWNNILAYDHSRVKVSPNKFNGGTDYVNANWIDGHKKKRMYIASQGPVAESIYAFWQMLMEQRSNLIVMVTNLIEGENKLKCHQYWPSEPGTRTRIGDIVVEHVSETVEPLSVKRKFRVTYNGETRAVTHHQYTAWPDHGVPNTTEELLKFRHEVRESYRTCPGPMVVHCSAGVGRTGTFIGLDRYLDSCTDLDDSVNVLDIVRNMRGSRNYMVQAPAQFEYLYMAAYDGLVILLEKLRRDLAVTGMSEEERVVQKQAEIDEDIAEVTERFWARCHGMEQKLGVRVAAHASHTLPSEQRDKELAQAAKVKPQTRLESLAKSKEIWMARGNVPMDAEEHGYKVESTPLEERLSALAQSRLDWTRCYDEAVRSWQSAQDHEGVVYDIGHQLTSIESRVASLSAAETSWMLRGDGQRSVADQIRANKMAEVGQRLESLQSEVVNSEARWRARGDGFRQKVDEKELARASNVEAMGGLVARLRALSTASEEWVRRGELTRYEEEKFYREIAEIEDKEQSQREAKESAAKADAAAKAKKAEVARRQQEERERARREEEQERLAREARKAKMRQKSAIQEEWTAHKAQQEREAKKKAEADAKKKAEDDARAAKEQAAADEAAAKEAKKQAALKASRFLKKQSK